MLWLCLYLPRLPLSALGAVAADSVVVDQHGAQRWLITDAPHSPAGTPLARALALHPELKAQVRRPAAEQAALQSLAYWIYRYGQPVVADIQDLREPGRAPRALLWVEIGQSLTLFGGLKILLGALCRELAELGHAAQLGVAPTRAGAALLACTARPALAGQDAACQADDGHADSVLEPAGLSRRLGPLPLHALHWPGELLQTLHGVGFRSLDDLYAVPRAAFTKRFGACARQALDRLLGMAADPYDAIVPPEVFRRRFELASEIEDTERLQFPLKRLCAELQAYLSARDRGLRSVSLAVLHAGARETRLHAQFVDPHRDARRIFDALHERLERDGLPLPARELILLAEDFAEAAVPQCDLFDARAGQAQQWNAAVERIRGRLGEARAWTPACIEDHRPERAIRPGPGLHAIPAAATKAAMADMPRPVFLLSEPWPMPSPQLAADASFERIESGWWDGHDVRRDYTTLTLNGARAWAFRNVENGQWFVHGWWS